MNILDIKKLLLVILYCTIPLSLLTGTAVFAQEQASQGEVVDVLDSRTPRGWINVVSTASVIINDTYYILTGSTRFPDGRNVLKEGEFVTFKILEENTLAQISLAQPLAEDMYMKPIIRNTTAESTEGEAGKSDGAKPAGKKTKGMRLENGVWVN